MLESYRGVIEVNGQKVDRLNLHTMSNTKGSLRIKITPDNFIQKFHDNDNPQVSSVDTTEYRVTVRACMLKKASPEFDFMAKWNNDNPMPLRTMIGKKIKETRGMVYMELHGDTTAKVMHTCLRCGRQITNPVSQYFGMGPECGGHNYTSPFDTEEELKAAVEAYRRNVLQKITWSGWIIKSWILECEEVR